MNKQNEHFLITGARGFIGSWICRLLIEEGVRVTATDIAPDPRSMSSVLDQAHLDQIRYVQADVRDAEKTKELVADDVTSVIYLAGLLRPASEENPGLSAAISVGGLINAFDAIVPLSRRPSLVYSSTAAVYGPVANYPGGKITAQSEPGPLDHYGLHRWTMEQTAEVYHKQHGIPSVGLRPWVVYGAGRFNGLSAQPSLAMLAAAARAPFEVQFGGRVVVQHVRDVALAFIRSARANPQGALCANIPGESVDINELIAEITDYVPEAKGKITCNNKVFETPSDLDDERLENLIGPLPSPTGARVRETIDEYERLLAQGRISWP
ncbi:NAD-dependent epimerase/dehydratase family protein [Vannielia litorea]|uniref:Nucleoside-diphosphate-sugar epimerase n=1 Tax=Vannielia litorea TaxID=1217970 RepID=A0A1N6GTX0_9RHOB|nr:NAD(P)-dependent oxidoreductase [Vannielia litorea]SIO10922.1 Nucleoside-diphosphate-sugar epimerase [Vannielia litorea]